MPRIEWPEGDALGAWLERVVNGVVAASRPSAVHVVELDHWFDEKWLGFRGKTLGALGTWRMAGLRVPPFHPHRVRAERHYVSDRDDADYRMVPDAPTVHRRQWSSDNLQRRLEQVVPGTACFWYAGDAAATGRGALMAYVPAQGGAVGWYVGLKREAGTWRVVSRSGIGAAELACFEEGPRPVPVPVRPP